MSGVTIKVKLPGLHDSHENVVEFNRKIASALREIGSLASNDWRALNMAAVVYGKVPNRTSAAEFGGEVPGSDYMRRESRRYARPLGEYSKGTRFKENRGEYAKRKAKGWLYIRGYKITGSTQPLGILTGDLFIGVASAHSKTVISRSHAITITMRMDAPRYFSIVHDGNESQNIAERPFVEVNWDLFIRQDLWIRINRLMKASLNIWVSPSLYKFWMNTGYVSDSYGFEK